MTEDKTTIAIEAASKIVDVEPAPDQVTMSNGVVLNCKSVPIMTLRQSQANLPRPKIPIIRNEEKDRNEEWEGDPQYQQDLQDWEEAIGDIGTNVMLLLGTSIDHIPEDVYKPEDQEWIDVLEATGIGIKTDTEAKRYLSWLRFYVIATPHDLLIVSENIAKKSGVLDRDAQASLESFRRSERRDADLESKTEELDQHRDRVQSTNGRSHLRSGDEE